MVSGRSDRSIIMKEVALRLGHDRLPIISSGRMARTVSPFKISTT